MPSCILCLHCLSAALSRIAWIPRTSMLINVFGEVLSFSKSFFFNEMLVCLAYLTCVMTRHCASLLSVMADCSEGVNSGPISLQCTVSVYCPTFSWQEDI